MTPALTTGTPYWRGVAAWQSRLETMFAGERTFFITSIESLITGQVGGKTFEVNMRIDGRSYGWGAQRLAEGTHRIATLEEIERYKREDLERSEQCAKQTQLMQQQRSGERLVIDRGRMNS